MGWGRGDGLRGFVFAGAGGDEEGEGGGNQ